MTEVQVVVPVFGDVVLWREFAARAEGSVATQTVPTDCVVAAGDNLADARNMGLRKVTAEWVVFLDADDYLSPDYVECMLGGSGDVRWPSVQRGDTFTAAEVGQNRLPEFNHIVCGAMVRAGLVREVGGFRDWPVLEDFDLWCRLHYLGVDMRPCPGAVYYHTVREGSMSASWGGVHDEVWQAIREDTAAWAAGLVT